MEENIFEKACLIQISVSAWGGSLQLPPQAMQKIGDADWLKGRKNLVDPEYLIKIKSIGSGARIKISRYALPFPIHGMMMVPKESISMIEEELQSCQDKFWNEVESFVEVYDQAREEAEVKLGEYYNETDYPSNIRRKFNFEWRYVTVSTPGQNTILSPELYEKERQKFVNMMGDARTDAVSALRSEFAEFVNHLVEKLQTKEDGKPMKFKDATVVNFQEFLEMFNNRNIFKDNELTSLVEKARGLIANVDPKHLRDTSGSLREHIRDEFQKVSEEMNSLITNAPRRRIVLPTLK